MEGKDKEVKAKPVEESINQRTVQQSHVVEEVMDMPVIVKDLQMEINFDAMFNSDIFCDEGNVEMKKDSSKPDTENTLLNKNTNLNDGHDELALFADSFRNTQEDH